LTAITTNGDYEFNFVFENGKTSDVPMSGQASKVVQIKPPDSIVRKIIVGYYQLSHVTGFKLFDAKGTCVLDIRFLSGY